MVDKYKKKNTEPILSFTRVILQSDPWKALYISTVSY